MKTNALRIAGAAVALSAALSLTSFAEVVTKSETVSSQPAPVTEQTTTTTTTETPLTHHQIKRIQHEKKKQLKADYKAAKERTEHPDRELRKEAREGTLPPE
jgi:Spy/CpxP family protein refolding chaperone